MSCADEILEAARRAGIQFSDEEAAEIVSILEERLAKKVANANADEYVDIAKLAKQIARQARINAVIEKRSRILNAKAYATIMSYLKANPDTPGEALSAIMVGSAKYLESGLNSVDARQQAIMVQTAGELAATLRRHGLEKTFKSGELEELIFEAMFNPKTFDVSRTGGKEAKQIADIIKKMQKRMLDRKNLNGAVIAELENHVVRQGHDPILLRDGAKTDAELEAARTRWVDYMLEPGRLASRTFENKPSMKNGEPYTERMFLEDVWNNLVSGDHQKVGSMRGDDGSVDKIEAFKGPSNLAKKLSQSRVIHFADGKSAYEYHKKYTRMSLSEAVLNGFTHDAQAIALMETFGTNPEAMFNRVLNDIKTGLKDKPAQLGKFREKRLINEFKELDGSTRARGAGRPVAFGADFAGIASGWRMIQNMAKLGMATISSFGDIATKAHFINTRTDRGIFGSYAAALSDVFKGFNRGEQQELAYLLGVGVEAMLGDVHARFGANDSLPGMIGKAHQIFFRLNGMNWWNSAQKVGVARMLSADLAMHLNKSFDDIPQRTKLSLQRYGITETDWKLMSDMELRAVDGRDYVTPTGILDLPDSVVAKAALDKANATRKRKLKKPTDAMIQRYRDDLATKVATYFSDSADTAIPTPGARERAIMNQGLERGTVMGEGIRMIMQLKGFPITYVTKGMTGQFYARRQAGQSGAVGIAQMMIGTTMMGYLSVATKDILKGKEPLEVFDEDTYLNVEYLTKAFVQGGGAGIYGDFLFGEYNKYGQTLSQTLLGPTLGSVDDIARIYSNTIEAATSGDTDKLTKSATQFVIRNTPGLNLFYAKTAVDYLFVYGMMEKVNPGYLRRMERRMEKDLEQEFYFPPSRYAQRF